MKTKLLIIIALAVVGVFGGILALENNSDQQAARENAADVFHKKADRTPSDSISTTDGKALN